MCLSVCECVCVCVWMCLSVCECVCVCVCMCEVDKVDMKTEWNVLDVVLAE